MYFSTSEVFFKGIFHYYFQISLLLTWNVLFLINMDTSIVHYLIDSEPPPC